MRVSIFAHTLIEMIVVTGASGFIGSCLITQLNSLGYHDIIAVDLFDDKMKERNLAGKSIAEKIDRSRFFSEVKNFKAAIEYIFHFGARTDTTETSVDLFDELNLEYSKRMWQLCAENEIPLAYASSAATYGDGAQGFSDDLRTTHSLIPLNPYASSKHNFDLWALNQELKPPSWTGLKFFNVFGPNEYHKDRMASMVFQAYNQIKSFGQVRLFKSYQKEVKDGEQKRDFVYVMDIVDLCTQLLVSKVGFGILNTGTGEANSFNEMCSYIFRALKIPENITYIPMPDSIRPKYQYYTEADTSKVVRSQLTWKPTSLDRAITHYVQDFLEPGSYY